MSYELRTTLEGESRIVLQGEPNYCHALEPAPPVLEPVLERGAWLVGVFAVWSMPDYAAIERGLDVAKRFHGALQLGLRPFKDENELRSWLPAASRGPTPIWALLRGGTLLKVLRGQLDRDALSAEVTRTLGLEPS